MRTCHTEMTEPGTVADVLEVRGASVVPVAAGLPWVDAVDVAVLLMQDDDGPDAVAVGALTADDVPALLTASPLPAGVLLVRPGVIREDRDG